MTWTTARRESFNGYTLETLRQRSGPGAHRVAYGNHWLFVGPDGATSSRARRGRIVAALERYREPMFARILAELKTIGAYDFEIDGHTAGLSPKATHQRRVLDLLVVRPQCGCELASKVTYQFSQRIFDLRRNGYVISKTRSLKHPNEYTYRLGDE